MNLGKLGLTTARLPAGLPARVAGVGGGELVAACRLAHEQDAELVTLWVSDDSDRGQGFCLRVLLRDAEGLALLEHRMPRRDSQYPDLGAIFPAAVRMQRAAFDLTGIAAQSDDQRPWLWMGAWPRDRFPLRRDFDPVPPEALPEQAYPFVRVEGDGVHEISVGPVHAGTIEPGNFLFQVVGEKVLRIEERLSYTHKGVARRFTELPFADAHRLAGRICGDSTVAYAWAFAQAVEAIAGVAAPPRALRLRALALECERLAMHLGDLGALGNDAGLAFGLMQFSRLREDHLRWSRAAFGHRLAMDFVVPGGVAHEPPADALAALPALCAATGDTVGRLRQAYDEHAGLQDRFRSCGRLPPTLARELGVTGLVARASGRARDLRCDFPLPPWEGLAVRCARRDEGDVAARVAVRFDEALESLRLLRVLAAEAAPEGASAATLPSPLPPGLGIGTVEGWRGPVTFAVETGEGGAIRRCHHHDPSWQNWPALGYAVPGNIVPDFPLINKSFNLAYSGHDG